MSQRALQDGSELEIERPRLRPELRHLGDCRDLIEPLGVWHRGRRPAPGQPTLGLVESDSRQ